MKKCPMCAEDIQDEAKICRFCNHNLDATETKDYTDISIKKSIIPFIAIWFMLLMSLLMLASKESQWVWWFFIILFWYIFLRYLRYDFIVYKDKIVKKTWVILTKEEEMVFQKIESIDLQNVLVWQNLICRGTGWNSIEVKFADNGKQLRSEIMDRK